MLLTLATGIMYFVLVVVGVSLSAGLAILIIGVPFFLVFISITRVVSLGEGRLIEAITGERMPRRPVHPGPTAGWGARIGAMLSDARTWTTLLYFVLMLPLGIFYFVTATVLKVLPSGPTQTYQSDGEPSAGRIASSKSPTMPVPGAGLDAVVVVASSQVQVTSWAVVET